MAVAARPQPQELRAPVTRAFGLPVLAALAALVSLVAVELVALRLAGGVFEYPLDDVYIHLAMAEGIAGGTYGINPGSPASASSSALYPLLLVPLAASTAGRFLPLLWNGLATGLCGWLWGRVLVLGQAPLWLAIGLAVAGPLALNLTGVAFTGMEHALHGVTALLVLIGLFAVLQGRAIPLWWAAALVAAPLLRLEGVALSLLALAALALAGRGRAALALSGLVLAPLAGFALFLVAQGLEPLPSSVLSKLDHVAHGAGVSGRVLVSLAANLGKPAGMLIAALSLLLLVLGSLLPRPGSLLPAAAGLAGLAHLAFAQIGWMHRYEAYAVLMLVAALGLCLPAARGAGRAALGLALVVAVAASALVYVPPLVGLYVWNSRLIHLQQAQMARFSRDFLPWPVAVNDIGRVAWANPAPVLDLWGLADSAARRIRTAEPPPATGWAAPLAKASGVRYAMIYDGWLGQAVGPDWRRVATLSVLRPVGVIGATEVAFYATSAADAPALIAALQRFAPTLPADAQLSFEALP